MALLISEIFFNPPGTDAPNEYVEIIGDPGAVIAAGTYLVAIEGDTGTANIGDVQNIFNLSGATLGSNGILVLAQAGNTYSINPSATVRTGTTTGFGGLTGYSADSSATDIENTSVTFLLIQSGVVPTLTDDIDANNDANPDGAIYAGWTILDLVAVVDNAADAGFGPVVFAVNGAGMVGTGVTAVNAGASTPNWVGRQSASATTLTPASWAAGGTAGTAPNFNLVAGETTPASFGGEALNDLGAPNSFGDTTAPTLNSADPADNSPNVAAGTNIVLTFSETVQAGTGNITITDGGSDVRTIADHRPAGHDQRQHGDDQPDGRPDRRHRYDVIDPVGRHHGHRRQPLRRHRAGRARLHDRGGRRHRIDRRRRVAEGDAAPRC